MRKKVDRALSQETVEVVLLALANCGVDVDCGACMEIAFTGVTLAEHDCDVRHDVAVTYEQAE